MNVINRIIRIILVVVVLVAVLFILINGIGLITNFIVSPQLEKQKAMVLDMIDSMKPGYVKSLAIEDNEPLTAGNAYDFYAEAIKDNISLQDQTTVRQYLQTGLASTRDSVLDIAETYQQALNKLGEGIRSSECVIPFDYKKGFTAELPPFVNFKNLNELLLANGKARMNKGEEQTGLGLVLNALVLSLDIGNGLETLINKMVSYVLMEKSIAVLVNEIPKRYDETKSLDKILRFLNAVHEQMPCLGSAFDMEWRSMAIMPVEKAYWLITAGNSDINFFAFLFLRASAYKYFFSEKLMFLDAIKKYKDITERIKKIEDKGWKEAQETWSAVENECRRSNNTIIKIAIPSFSSMMARKYKLVANLRLLTTACQVLRYEKIYGVLPEDLRSAVSEEKLLNDPFTMSQLIYQPDKEKKHFMIYSVGKNLADNNGAEDDIIIRF